MQIGCRTDVGRKRQLNEDSVMTHKFDAIFPSSLETGALFVVADGMGGHNAGEIASELGVRVFASECLRRLIVKSDKVTIIDNRLINKFTVQDIFDQAIQSANEAVAQQAQEQGLQGMGTTIVAALIIGQNMYITNVGDSRCYLINGREITQITRDHSLVQEMADAGMITPEEAMTHPRRNEITRAIGAYPEITGDFYFCKLYEGDTILLCSDGLTSMLPEQKIAEITLNAASPDQACNDLIAMANEAGGIDNITVIVVRPGQLPSLTDIIASDTEISQMPVTEIEYRQ